MFHRFHPALTLSVAALAAALILAAGPAVDRAAHPLRLNTGFEDGARWAPFAGAAGRSEFAIALSDGPITPRFIAALEAAGARVVNYVPDDALLIRFDGGRAAALRGIAGLAGLKAIPARVKVSPAVAIRAREGKGAGVGLYLKLAPGAAPDAVLARLSAAASLAGPAGEFRVTPDRGRGARLLARAAGPDAEARALAMAADPDVEFVEPAPEFILSNDAARWVLQNFDSNGSGADAILAPVHAKGITGQGQVVGIIDDGLDPRHACFYDSAHGDPDGTGSQTANALQRKVIFYHIWDATLPWENCPGEGHGGHTAGTVACDFNGNGTWDPAAGGNPPEGMAPAAKLAISDAGTTDPPGIPADLGTMFQETYNVGARIHSNSWGTCGGSPACYVYSTASQETDQFMWEHPDFLAFFAAANEGGTSNTVTPPGTAKDIVTVGATNRGTGANSIAGFSSRGPTADGRIKPTITAPGVSTNSVLAANGTCAVGAAPAGTANHTGATTLSGTSMATPASAGVGALVRQYYTDGWYPTGAAVAANGFTPSGALVKATLVNGARKMGYNLPGNEQGYGRISLKEALFFAGGAAGGYNRNLFVDDHKNGLVQGDGAVTYKFNVTATTAPLKVTLVWTDPPPAIISGTAKALVNDLNLTVTAPGGATVYRGNVFNTATGFSQTGGVADSTNVEEEVWVNNPPAGVWTVTVTPQNLPIGPQPYALVVTGAYQTPVAGTPAFDSARVNDSSGNRDGAADPGETVGLQINVRELAGSPIANLNGTLASLDATKATVSAAGPFSFGNLPAGGTALNATPFTVAIPAAAPCGALAPMRLTLTDGVLTYLLDFGLRLGSPGKTPVVSVIDNFDATPSGSPPNAALWTIAGNTAVDNSIVTTPTADTGANAVHLLQNLTAPGSVLQTKTLNLSGANSARLAFSYWANDITADANGPYFRVEACAGAVATTCAPSAAGWQMLYGNPNHFSGTTGLNFNSNTLTPPVWSPIAIDLTGTSLIGNSQVNFRFRFSQTGASAESITAAYVDSVNFSAYSYACSQPAASQLLLKADKTGGKVHLFWTGGTAPWSLYRLRNGLTDVGPLVLNGATKDENLLGDGVSYMWRVE